MAAPPPGAPAEAVAVPAGGANETAAAPAENPPAAAAPAEMPASAEAKPAHAGPAHSWRRSGEKVRTEQAERPKAEAASPPPNVPAKASSPSIQRNRAGKLSVDDF